jgi:catechol 2,3-dioxygenase-like lactoylglutathione lyase family enzyme
MNRLALVFFALVLRASAVAQEQAERPPIIGLAYVRIAVSDMAKARGFYVENLGFASQECEPTGTNCLQVNSSQNLQLEQTNAAPMPNLVTTVAFATADVRNMQRYLQTHGVRTSKISRRGIAQFEANDPEGHRIVFTQIPMAKPAGWPHAPKQVSARLIHAGFIVKDRAAEDHFYRDILGFHLYWHGGMKDDATSWVDMQVPDGTDWIEYMLNVPDKADHHTLGVMNHVALGVPDIRAAEEQLRKNGWSGNEQPKIGLDGKWQLNLYDPDDTRVELMEFTPTQKPCCSDYSGPHPGSKQ